MRANCTQDYPTPPMQGGSAPMSYVALLRALSDSELRYVREKLAGGKDEEACERAKVSRATISHSPRLGLIREVIRLARFHSIEMARERLRREAVCAADTLVEIAGDRKAPAAARVRASVAILDRVGVEPGQIVTHQEGESLADLLRAARDSLAQQQDDETDDPDAIYERYYGAHAGGG